MMVLLALGLTIGTGTTAVAFPFETPGERDHDRAPGGDEQPEDAEPQERMDPDWGDDLYVPDDPDDLPDSEYLEGDSLERT